MSIGAHSYRQNVVHDDLAVALFGEVLSDGVDHLGWGDGVGGTEMEPQWRVEVAEVTQGLVGSAPVPGGGRVQGRSCPAVRSRRHGRCSRPRPRPRGAVHQRAERNARPLERIARRTPERCDQPSQPRRLLVPRRMRHRHRCCDPHRRHTRRRRAGVGCPEPQIRDRTIAGRFNPVMQARCCQATDLQTCGSSAARSRGGRTPAHSSPSRTAPDISHAASRTIG